MPDLPPYLARWSPAGAAASPSTRTTAFDDRYPVPLRDGSVLELPLRPLPGGRRAIALLMSNQTPFAVEDGLAGPLADEARAFAPEAIAVVPTMGLDYGRRVARALGHADAVVLGLSRKFWYDEALSQPVVSMTSPDTAKRLYLDPALVTRVAGRRVLLVDDVITTGASAAAAVRLLQQAGGRVCGLLVVLTEGHGWRQALATVAADLPDRVRALGHLPIFERGTDGRWWPDPATA